MNPNAKTHNNATAYESSGDTFLNFFSKAGSLYLNKGTHYGDEYSALDLFKSAWNSRDYITAMKLLFWLRDIRFGGAGNRSGARSIYNWLAKTSPEWIIKNIESIPKYGRWDDLFCLYKTPCEKAALDLWARAITAQDALACKWVCRKDKKLREFMNMSPKDFRKLLARGTRVVETKMCAKEWNEITYNSVPSVAMGRYTNAFKRNDQFRYLDYVNSLVTIDEQGNMILTGKVNAEALLPHDLVRTIKNSNTPEAEKLVDAQLLSMPNYIKGNLKILPIVDTSASMDQVISKKGSITAMDVSISLGLYCSEKIGSDNPFYRKVIPFSTNAYFADWNGKTFKEGMETISNGYVGSTNIVSALDLILDSAKLLSAKEDQMPDILLIISDMQFDDAISYSEKEHWWNSEDFTPLENAFLKWDKAGYKRPKIVLWDTSGYKNTQATFLHNNFAMVSGFSPSILKAILGGQDFSPLAIMQRAIDSYEVKIP